jgi:hypothetical protein
MNPQIDFNTLIEESRHAFAHAIPLNDCPDDAELADYVYGDMDAVASGQIAIHLESCEACHIRKLKMEADLTEWDMLLENNPDEALRRMLGPEGMIKITPFLKKSDSKASSAISKIKEALITWVSPLWEPPLTGEMMTAAADIPEQSRHFKMEHGEYINISCAWKGKDRTASAIMLAWNANIFTNSQLWARFIDPETRDILFESCLGTKLEGEKTFSEDETGFNPCSQKWAVAIIVEEAA